MIDFGVISGPLLGIAIIYGLIKLVKLPLWLIKNSVVGAIMLYISNFIGLFTIKITFIHALIAGVFGIPGIIVLFIYLNMLKG